MVQLTLKHFIFCAVLGLAGSVDLSFAVQKKPLDQDLSRVSPKQESKASVGASQKVLAPKVEGSIYLDSLFSDVELEFFVFWCLFTS